MDSQISGSRRKLPAWRFVMIAFPLALFATLFFPMVTQAHAILLRSDPAQGEVLRRAPTQVRMWFSEDLNATFSTAAVLTTAGQHVDHRDAHLSQRDPREMDMTIVSALQPGVYLIFYRSTSIDDGHSVRGSFLFSIAQPDGTVPTSSRLTFPKQDPLGGDMLAEMTTGQLDSVAFFNLIVVSLAELAAVFWVGASLWSILVHRAAHGAYAQEQDMIHRHVQQRFVHHFSLPTLLLLLLATIGILAGQGITITGGNWATAFASSFLWELATSSRYGTFWLLREVVIVVAILVSCYHMGSKKSFRLLDRMLPWLNCVLGIVLFTAIAMSSHAAAVNTSILGFAVLVDVLHLFAAALWVGGMLYIALIYIPVLVRSSLAAQARSLLTVLPAYSPWAIVGVILMAVTGPFSATFHLHSWEQLLTTAYGLALVLKIVLVCSLLLISATHVLLLRPRLHKEMSTYTSLIEHQRSLQMTGAAYRVEPLTRPKTPVSPGRQERPAPLPASVSVLQQAKLGEERLAQKVRHLTRMLRFEPWLGVAVIICVGLMNVYAGTLAPTVATPPKQQQPAGIAKPFEGTTTTSDGRFMLTLTITPNRFGPNVFTVSVVDKTTGKPATNVGVTVYTTMLDMDMGTNSMNLQPDGRGHFSATGDLGMAGNWQMRIQVRTLAHTLHTGTLKLRTAA